MPIRTRRGRGAAYRALWEWPLHSPRRLLSCLVGVLAVGLTVSLLSTLVGGAIRGPGVPAPAGAPGAAAAPTNAAAAPGAGVPRVAELAPPTLPLSAASPAALAAAGSWAAAWVTHPQGTSIEQWLAGLAPYTTDEFLGTLSTVDVTNIPASRVAGAPRPVQAHADSVLADVPTDGPTLRVLVVDTGATGWKVAGYDKAVP